MENIRILTSRWQLHKKGQMKVSELREKLSKLKKDEVVKIASEFYKLVPKSKKEDYDLDSYVHNSGKKKKPSKPKEEISLQELETDVNTFIENASNQYYLIPNRVIPKKERSKWRFKVKRWYKELTNKKRNDENLELQSKLLCDLYELICESCGYQYFSAYDPFQSIGIEQSTFYLSVIHMLQESKGKADALKPSIELIINNHLNRYTLYSELMADLIGTLDNVDLKYKGIKISENLINLIGNAPSKKGKYSFSSEEFRKKREKNNLAELGLRLYADLYETEEGINFYHKHYDEDDEEVKLYVLIRILFELRDKENIEKEMEKAINRGIELRSKLVDLLNEIKRNDKLPRYMG